MATWQFDLHLIPRDVVERHLGAVAPSMTRLEFDEIPGWPATTELIHDVSSVLPPTQSWSGSFDMYGKEDGDRIDVCGEHSEMEIFVRIDVRSISMTFLTRLIDIAERHNLILRLEDGVLLNPVRDGLLSAIHKSPAFAFVQDPVAFFRSLSAAGERFE